MGGGRAGLAPGPLPVSSMAGVYVRRSPTSGVLYRVIRTHLTDFLANVAARTDGSGLPAFVTAEFRKFLRCGVLAHGFARVRCEDCAFERLLPFPCKGRGFCPSYGGRMAERAARLVEHVFPSDVPVRQWVLSVPHRLRYRLAYDHQLCRAVLGVFVRALRSAYRRQARRHGLAGGETSMVTSVQRFGGALNLHVHFHTLALDGVFVRGRRNARLPSGRIPDRRRRATGGRARAPAARAGSAPIRSGPRPARLPSAARCTVGRPPRALACARGRL
jgi:hypothetical protein